MSRRNRWLFAAAHPRRLREILWSRYLRHYSSNCTRSPRKTSNRTSRLPLEITVSFFRRVSFAYLRKSCRIYATTNWVFHSCCTPSRYSSFLLFHILTKAADPLLHRKGCPFIITVTQIALLTVWICFACCIHLIFYPLLLLVVVVVRLSQALDYLDCSMYILQSLVAVKISVWNYHF